MDTATTCDSSEQLSRQSSSVEVEETPVPSPETLVTLDSIDDPLSAQNWPLRKKLWTALAYGLCCVSSTFASALLSPATGLISHRFGISDEVATFSTATLFLFGYVAGPFVWAPMSERLGRKIPMCLAMFGFVCFGAASATAKDYQTLCLSRFFQGAMGACPVAITIASFADMFNPFHRAYASTVFALTVFSGPMLASPVGGFTADNHSLGWHWCAWWGVLAGALSLLVALTCASETYLPYLLKQKAVELRHETGNWALHSRLEEIRLPPGELVKSLFKRPCLMMVQEPILMLVSVYTAFVYALLYTFLDAYSVVFVEGYHMNLGVGGLPFFGLVTGLALAAFANILQQRFYVTPRLKRNNGVMVPEWRMPIAMTGALAFPLGLFWFGWTGAYPHSIHWIVPTASGIVTGYGILIIFMSFFTYLVDVYKTNSASAFAAATIIRSGLAAAFPLFATQMFHNLKVQFATTLLALLAVLLAPVPVLFYFYGARIRARSRFALDESGLEVRRSEKVEEEDEEEKVGALRIPTRGSAVHSDRHLKRILSGEDNWMGSIRSVTREEMEIPES
ncbi:hypothetical protein PV08_00118 [Exophiala spinifera]|uniref:Major facilitator superfamily (MFS) profile domain-containing protein n=1 Tax=Exophiala spinifera TaxID=91928 RepID=A0A0D1YWB0_9EURO|nr:uncharacterized protein PV08_00118 [Exophiala spinifera]KIW19546.1 hypothetical protein PV08_00118 [Exophiala spinifera]